MLPLADQIVEWNTQEFHVGQIKHHGPPKEFLRPPNEAITLPKTNIASQAPIFSEAKKKVMFTKWWRFIGWPLNPLKETSIFSGCVALIIWYHMYDQISPRF